MNQFSYLKTYKVALIALGAALLLSLVKASIHATGWEVLALNTLVTSAIGSVIFILGFLLAGIISDYKEAERVPSELRAALENILEESRMFEERQSSFSHQRTKEIVAQILVTFFAGIRHKQNHDLLPCVTAIDELSDVFGDMETLGMPPNFIVRLKTEQGIVRRLVLRVQHIQRTKFIPSAHILAESLVVLVVLLLCFVETEGSPESMVVFVFLSYLFVYVGLLIRIVEAPFREGAASKDDVSLFLLRELRAKVSSK